MIKSDLIKILSNNSDYYGEPHLLGILNDTKSRGLRELSEKDLVEYISKNDELQKDYENYLKNGGEQL